MQERVAEVRFSRTIAGRVDPRWPDTWHVTVRDLEGASLPNLAIRLKDEFAAAAYARAALARLGGGRLLTYDINGFIQDAEPVAPAGAPSRLSSLAA
jgi:hypothetical protein